jgi:hypothetical protein
MFGLDRRVKDVMVTPLVALRQKRHRQQQADCENGNLNWAQGAHKACKDIVKQSPT